MFEECEQEGHKGLSNTTSVFGVKSNRISNRPMGIALLTYPAIFLPDKSVVKSNPSLMHFMKLTAFECWQLTNKSPSWVFPESSLAVANNKYLFPTQQYQCDFIIKQSAHLQGWKHNAGLLPVQFLQFLLVAQTTCNNQDWCGLHGHPSTGSWTRTKIIFVWSGKHNHCWVGVS